MTMEETQHQQFRGVVCLHCKAPIPVPAVVGRTGVDLREGEEALQGNSQVFAVRCPVCLKEKPYWTKEIVTFEGIPEFTVSFAYPVSVHAFGQGEIAKVVKA